MGPWPWLTVSGVRVFDGYVGMWRTDYPDEYMLLTFLPTLPASLRRRPRHHLEVDAYDSSSEPLAVKSWPWGDPAWGDRAFERGWADAIGHIDALRAKVLAFLEE
eukprot:2430594-Prymnesium_polylepis.1